MADINAAWMKKDGGKLADEEAPLWHAPPRRYYDENDVGSQDVANETQRSSSFFDNNDDNQDHYHGAMVRDVLQDSPSAFSSKKPPLKRHFREL